MRITTKGRYGVRAMVNLASQYQDGPVSISRIAQDEQISAEFLEQIFFKLKKAGLIRSVRGPKGGFVLALRPGQISLRDILVAVGESVYPAPCVDSRIAEQCARAGDCVMHAVWRELGSLIGDFLAHRTIKDISADSRRKYYADLGEKQEFMI